MGRRRTAYIGVLLTACATVAPATTGHAAGRTMNDYRFSPGASAVVRYPDFTNGGVDVTQGTLTTSVGLPDVSPLRSLQTGDTFYLRITYSQDNPRPEMGWNISPSVTLPAGLVRADSTLPVRCAAVLPPRTTWTEYVGGCSLAASSPSDLTVLSRSGVTPAPAFLAIPGTRWVWFVPVRSTRPLSGTAVTATLTGSNSTAIRRKSVSTGAIIGDPTSPIWQAYLRAPAVSSSWGLVNSWGVANSGAVRDPGTPAWWPWPTRPADLAGWSTQKFTSLLDGSVTWAHFTTAHGVHRDLALVGQGRPAWFTYLGPAIDERMTAAGGGWLQHFAGGVVWYDGSLQQVLGKLTYPAATTAPLVEYRIHMQNLGWLPWVGDSTLTGAGGRLRAEALDVRADQVVNPLTNVCIQGHVQYVGWQPEQCAPTAEAGTVGRSLRLEAVRIRLQDASPPVFGASPGIRRVFPWQVCYTVFLQDGTWQPEVCDGAMAGTTGRSLAIAGIRVRLKHVG